MLQNENDIIQQVLEGNTVAFEYFVNTYQDMAITIAFRICKNKQDAEDIAQSAFVKAYLNLSTFQKKSKFSSWFYRIVYHSALTFINQNKLPESELEVNEVKHYHSTLSTEAFVHQNELKLSIDSIVEKLPKEDALIITLYYLEEMSIKEIASVLSWTLSNVKIRLHRARKTLEAFNELRIFHQES